MYKHKFEAGTVFKMLVPIESFIGSKKPDWPTGYYRVNSVSPRPFSKEFNSYKFSKIRKDGTPYKTFSNGYDCEAWDKLVDARRVVVIDEPLKDRYNLPINPLKQGERHEPSYRALHRLQPRL